MSTVETAERQTALGGSALARDRARELLGQVMGLVALTVGCAALGAYLGRDLSGAIGLLLFIGAFACIIGLNVASARGAEQLALGLLFGLGALLGLAVAPVIADYANGDPSALWQAAGATAAFVAACGAYGYATRRDLSSWARTLFWALLALIAFGIVAIFVAVPNGHIIYAAAGLGIFGAFTIFDLSGELGVGAMRGTAPCGNVPTMSNDGAQRVVIVGGGFGGLHAALGLRRASVEVTLVDRRNFHLFQPLTYQVATGALSPGEVAYPLRAVFKRNRNVRVLLAEVARFDLERREVVLRPVAGLPAPEPVPYDTLIVAGGSHYSYFGHDEWSAHAAEVKSLESALTVRSRILAAFEAAELERDPGRRGEWLTFVVVGAGPTGVEMAGQIAELARDTLRRDFRAADPGSGRILLVEAADRVLTSFPKSLSAKAERSLRRLGVTPVLGGTVVDIDETGVTIEHAAGATRRIPARTVVWAAGVTASRLAAALAELSGAERDRAGRITVEGDLTLPGHPEVFALGDMVRVRGRDGSAITLPGVAPVAMQQGRYAARAVRARLQGRAAPPFRYRDKGNLATIGRAAAVADVKGVKLSGFLAWVTWLVVHLFYLVGFQNRLLVLIRWSISFATRGRGARLITSPANADAAGRPAAHPEPESTSSVPPKVAP